MRSIIQNSLFIALSVILLSCTTPAPVRTSGPVSSSDPVYTEPAAEASSNSSIENAILSNVNSYRRSRGLGALQMVAAASQQAYNHSRNMATGRTAFGHDGFDARVTAIRSSIGSISGWAENVAYGNLSAKGVVDVWLNSPGHKKNIEGNYNLTGIGVYKDRQGTLYFTQIFLKK
jgi:uncharacterized protein YkwD